jgi:hypothetical protein
MRYLALTIVTAAILSVLWVTATSAGQDATQAISRENTLSQAEATYNAALDTVLGKIATINAACSAEPCPAITTSSIGTIPGVQVAIEGDTNTSVGAGNSYTSKNLEQTTEEKRIAIDIAVNSRVSGTQFAWHRVIARVWNGASTPGVQVLSDELLGTTTDATPAPSDNGGCASTGSGCDPNAPSSPDPSVVQDVKSCNSGYGSGTCPGSGYWDESVYGSSAWGNNQSSETPP